MQVKRHYTCSPSTGASRSRDDFTYDYIPYVNSSSVSKHKNGKPKSPNPSVVVSDLTGNLTRPGDSVVLDIGESSSSSSSSEKLNAEALGELEDIKDDIDSPDSQVQHNDWEVRMLAAEMEKQERKRGLSLTDNSPLSNAKLSSTFLRRRRKLSDTETECSETDAEPSPTALSRPRASSLDQFNLRYGIGRGGIFKAMSIDRDKDKL